MAKQSIRLSPVLRNLHLWMGIGAGLFFCLMSLSGSLILFRDPIEHSLRPNWKAKSAERPEQVLSASAANILRQWPEAKITALNLADAPGEPNEFDIRLEDGGAEHVFTDAKSAEVLGTFHLGWLKWIVDLHKNLQSGATGKQIVGVIGICLFLVSFSGLVLWLIRKPDVGRLFRIRTDSAKAFNFDIHRSSGVLLNALLLVVSITGIYLAYPDAIQSAMGLTPAKMRQKQKGEGKAAKGEQRSIEEWIAAARNAVPGGTVRQIRFPGGKSSQLTARVWAAGDARPEGSNRVVIDPFSARVIQVDRAAEWSAAMRITQSAAPIHYAEWGGLPLKIIWSLVGLVPPLMFVSGLFMWLKPIFARRAKARAARLEAVEELVS